MTTQNIIYNPIGIIHTPFNGTKKIPRQGRFGRNNNGNAVIFPEFSKGLKDLESFTHAWLIFYFHEKHESLKLIQYPKGKDIPRGVFAIRSPLRPNKIGLTAVKIISVENNTIHFEGADMIDGTPLLDIKPYVPDIDCYPDAGRGWFEDKTSR